MAPERPFRIHEASTRRQGASPWPFWRRVLMLGWEYAWGLLCRWTPRSFNGWRLFVLRRFGARVRGRPFVHSGTRIQVPWNVDIHDRARTGDRTNLYSLDLITLGPGAVVEAEAYLCTGSHSLSDPALPLMTAPIVLKAGAVVGARAFVLPGVTLGERAVAEPGSVVTKSVPADGRVSGNPARPPQPGSGGIPGLPVRAETGLDGGR